MENKIVCPKCGEVFTIDEDAQESILKQVRDHAFQEELKERMKAFESEKASALKVQEAEANTKLNEALADKDKEIAELQKQIELSDAKAEKLKSDAVALKEKEVEAEKLKVSELQGKLNQQKTELDLAVEKAIHEKQAEIVRLNAQIENETLQHDNEVKDLKAQHANILKMKDEQIEQYKDFKTHLGTKKIGEDLEQYCLTEFNKVRMGMFPNASFGKDNEVSKESGSKGDFIFRDYKDGVEFISIMFEMKNQNSASKTKQTNEAFLKELDKDRNEKKCEYAILVSTLEEDSELYNQGIVDVSYKYPKMYVIRPQFFIPMITLLRNAALETVEVKGQLINYQQTNLDIVAFENELDAFKASFGKNFARAGKNFDEAIKRINTAIENLTKTRDALVDSNRQLSIANEKLIAMTPEKLAKKSPSIKAEIKERKKAAKKSS